MKNPNILFLSTIFVLLLTFCVALFSQVFFYAGLGHDGDRILISLITNKKFCLEEMSRMTFHIIYQLPAYLFILFHPSNSLSDLTRVFSFGLIMTHIFSILGCYLILPQNRKAFLFFPLIAFIIGPLTVLGISISSLVSVYSYLWLVGFIIYYSDLSLKTHKLFFLLSPIPLFLSHELMSYMGLMFSFLLVLPKFKGEKSLANRTIYFFVILVLLLSSVVAFYFIIFPHSITQRTNFFDMLFPGLFFGNKFNYLGFIGLLLLSLLSLWVFKLCLKKYVFAILSVVLVLTVVLMPILTVYELNILGFDFWWKPLGLSPYKMRAFVCLILPASLLVWLLFEKQKIKIENQKILLVLSCLVSISLGFHRVYRDLSYRKYQKQFVSQLLQYEGGVYLKDIKEFSFTPNYLSHFLSMDTDTSPFYISILYPMSFKVKTVILSDRNISYAKYTMEQKNKSYIESLKLALKSLCVNSFLNGNENRFFDIKLVESYLGNIKEIKNKDFTESEIENYWQSWK